MSVASRCAYRKQLAETGGPRRNRRSRPTQDHGAARRGNAIAPDAAGSTLGSPPRTMWPDWPVWYAYAFLKMRSPGSRSTDSSFSNSQKLQRLRLCHTSGYRTQSAPRNEGEQDLVQRIQTLAPE